MRDYEVMRAQYEGLLQRRENLAMDIERKRRGKQLEFRIIEPPIAGQFPVAPDRTRLLVMVLLAALGAGAGLTFLLHQLKPVYISPDSVYQDLHVPVLGSVSLAWTQNAKTKRRRAELGFVGGLALLLVFFGVVYLGLPRLTSIAQGIIA
ncbi:MAG: hypothetical protein P8102_14495 [Gammaproteobacteria bacterium]